MWWSRGLTGASRFHGYRDGGRLLTAGAAAVLLALVAAGGCAPAAAHPPAPAHTAASASSGDPRVAWLAEQTIRVRTLDPADEDFSDLAPLAEVLEGVRMVALGEPSHLDGAAFKAKVRLVKFLHQMGFDVLAFEGGLFDCRAAWESLRRGEEPARAFRQCLSGVWVGAAEVQTLYTYLGATARGKRPIDVAGFDCELTGEGSKAHLYKAMRRFFDRGAPSAVDAATWKDVEKALALVRDTARLPSPEARRRGAAALSKVAALMERPSLAAAHSADELVFWSQMLESLLALVEYAWSDPRPQEDDLAATENPRERQMAKNLLWLARTRYADRKIIVWTTSFHLARNVESAQMADGSFAYKGVRPMGEMLKSELKNEVYTLGLTAYEGKSGYASEPKDIGRAQEGSLEALAVKAGIENGILDFKGTGEDGGQLLGSRPLSRPIGGVFARADWGIVLDGLFFIKTMTPITAAQPGR